jgi:hypothetical protein
MKRRSFLQFLGLAPAAPLLPKIPAALPVVAAVPIIEQVTATEGPEVAGCIFTTTASYCEPAQYRFLVDLD